MNKFMLIILILVMDTLEAQIFKCETKKGKVVYQDIECKKTHKQIDVVVLEFDPIKILEARKKLDKELQLQQESQTIKAMQVLKERKIRAIEEQTRSNKELASAALENVHAIEKNTEAIKRRNHRKNLYYYNLVPPLHRARPHSKKTEKLISKRSGQKSGVKASISLKLHESRFNLTNSFKNQ